MSQSENQKISKVSRRGALKWAGALAAVGIVGVGLGFGADILLRPSTTTTKSATVTQPASTVTATATQTVTSNVTTTSPPTTVTTTASTTQGEQVFYHLTDGSGALQVHVANGRITRIRPAQFDPADLAAGAWSLNIGGQTYTPPKPSASTFVLSSKRRVYSPQRIMYPMQRVDFNPSGDRNPQNRGVSEYVRISWDEALTLVASELTRIKSTYGPSGLYFMFPSHWQHGGIIHDDHYTPTNRVLCLGLGGYTSELPNMDSWEGWYYGGPMTWGFMWFGGKPFGGQPPHWDTLQDVLEASQQVIMWSNDVLATQSAFNSGVAAATYLQWIKAQGKPIIFIDPVCNYTAGVFADKWIPINLGTDTALCLAIAYTWIQENTYNSSYIASHTYGFDAWQSYVLGTEDGVPKTPDWAAPITGVSAPLIRALARQWASKPTSVSMGFGGACRAPYGHEWSRMMILLQAMQGLGTPGVNLWDGSGGSPTNNNATSLPTTEDIGAPNIVCQNKAVNSVKQMIWRTQFADAVLNPPISWYGLGLFYLRFSVFPNFVPANTDPYEANFHIPWSYPQTGESQIHAIYKEGTSFLQNWVGTSDYIKAWQSSQMEFITMVDFWWGGDARFADILLPGTTTFERNDISGWLPTGGQYSWSVYCPQCIQPLGEAMGDLEIEIALADKLGVKSQYIENFQTEDDWIQAFWNKLSVNKYMTYDQWKQKGYFIFPFPANYQPLFPFRAWAAATDLGPNSTQIPPFMVLETPTNKIEFDAQRLESWWPNDTQRPPVPHYIVPPEVSDPTLTSKYTLVAMAPHDRWRMHTMYDEVSWLREIPTHKLQGSDGYYYERLWMNPADAASRGINDGDIVKAYNDRATVLFAAYVSERMVPGYVRATQDSKYDPLDPASSLFTDRGGAMNLLTSDAPLSQYASGMAPNDFRVEVAKWTGQ